MKSLDQELALIKVKETKSIYSFKRFLTLNLAIKGKKSI